MSVKEVSRCRRLGRRGGLPADYVRQVVRRRVTDAEDPAVIAPGGGQLGGPSVRSGSLGVVPRAVRRPFQSQHADMLTPPGNRIAGLAVLHST